MKSERNSLESIMQLAGQIHKMQQEQAVRILHQQLSGNVGCGKSMIRKVIQQ